MEYSKVYDVTRLMHARPCAEIVKKISKLGKEHDGIEIYLQNPDLKEAFGCKSLIGLIINVSENFLVGTKVKVIARGNYESKTLEKCVEEIGGLFLAEMDEE
jgi:phosphotransferase system HPr-like phosphotransfer protein